MAVMAALRVVVCVELIYLIYMLYVCIRIHDIAPCRFLAGSLMKRMDSIWAFLKLDRPF